MVHLMLDARLRFNEVCTLALADLNFDTRYIRVHGKDSKERIVSMAGSPRQHLYQYPCFYRGCPDSDILFLFGQAPVTDSLIKSLFTRLRKRTGIDRIRPHLLRHPNIKPETKIFILKYFLSIDYQQSALWLLSYKLAL